MNNKIGRYINMPVMIDEVLLNRENRVRRQQSLIDCCHMPIVSLSVNMPGNVKFNYNGIKIYNEASAEIAKALGDSIVHSEHLYLRTGCEGLYAVNMPAKELKEKMCIIEDTHPLGRLFDADVIDTDMYHLSRSCLHMPPRKCLICDCEATVCARSRKHTVHELLAVLDDIVKKWEKSI